MGMIAALPSLNPILPPCPVKWVGRQGLSINAISYCNRMASAASGIMQIPDDSKICESCKIAIASIPR